jgi:hypothetical protein
MLRPARRETFSWICQLGLAAFAMVIRGLILPDKRQCEPKLNPPGWADTKAGKRKGYPKKVSKNKDLSCP